MAEAEAGAHAKGKVIQNHCAPLAAVRSSSRPVCRPSLLAGPVAMTTTADLLSADAVARWVTDFEQRTASATDGDHAENHKIVLATMRNQAIEYWWPLLLEIVATTPRSTIVACEKCALTTIAEEVCIQVVPLFKRCTTTAISTLPLPAVPGVPIFIHAPLTFLSAMQLGAMPRENFCAFMASACDLCDPLPAPQLLDTLESNRMDTIPRCTAVLSVLWSASRAIFLKEAATAEQQISTALKQLVGSTAPLNADSEEGLWSVLSPFVQQVDADAEYYAKLLDESATAEGLGELSEQALEDKQMQAHRRLSDFNNRIDAATKLVTLAADLALLRDEPLVAAGLLECTDPKL